MGNMATPTYVQSLNPNTAIPVATTLRNYGGFGQGSMAIQHMIVTDPRSDNQWSIRSYAGSNPAAVALTDTSGAHLSYMPITRATGSTYENHEFTIPGSIFNMSFINSLGFTHATSCSCARSAFSLLPSARNISIRNVGKIAAGFRFNTTSTDYVTVDAGEFLSWDYIVASEMYVSSNSKATPTTALISRSRLYSPPP